MQSLAVISVNLWQTLISLANLILLFVIIKKFLFKPVAKMLAKRQADLDGRYLAAHEANENARKNESYWNNKIKDANKEADAIMQRATDSAKWRGDKIIEQAQDKADTMIRQAKTQAELEIQKATESIKREIVDVSTALAEKILSREINIEDHKDMIDSVLEKIGDEQ